MRTSVPCLLRPRLCWNKAEGNVINETTHLLSSRSAGCSGGTYTGPQESPHQTASAPGADWARRRLQPSKHGHAPRVCILPLLHTTLSSLRRFPLKHLPKVPDGPSLKKEEVRGCFTGNAPEFYLKSRGVMTDMQEGHFAETGRREMMCTDESHR